MKNNGNSYGRLAAPFLMDVVQLQEVVTAALPVNTTRCVTPHSYTLCITAVVTKHTLKFNGAVSIYNYFNKVI